MDPLSCTASLLTIIGATGVVGRGLQRVLALRNSPQILLDLNDEVAGMYLVLQAADCLVRQHTGTVESKTITHLYGVLEKSIITLSKLENVICHKLTTYNRHGEERLNKKSWLLAESKVRDLKERIRVNRLELSNALSIIASWVIQIMPHHITG